MDGSSQELVRLKLVRKGNVAAELIQFGLPLPQGQVFADRLSLTSQTASAIPAHFETIARWPDQSVRWCRVTAQVSADASAIVVSKLISTPSPAPRIKLVDETSNALKVRCQHVEFEIPTTSFSTFSCANNSGEALCVSRPIQLELADGQTADVELIHHQFREFHSDTGPLLSSVVMVGQACHPTSKEILANVSCELKFHYHNGWVEGAVAVHNPKAAEHAGGTWDLGDKGSLLFKQLALLWETPQASSLSCFDELSQRLVTADSELSVYQESSGGHNWDSPNHLNREKQIPLRFNGYQLGLDGEILEGKRIQPVLTTRAGGSDISLTLCDFWQQFPSKLAAEQTRLCLSLFPQEFPDLHELQAGEKKTQRFIMAFAGGDKTAPATSSNQTSVAMPSVWLEQCQFLPWFASSDNSGVIQNIVDEGLTGSGSFIAKRERVDQYGWRNFGELYADHEAEGHDGEDIFVSHYNNQYDPIYGLYRQALLSGCSDIFQQASQLARHVTDIDIYNTKLDKDEYNQGLFWHTDHYQKAETCGHRTYSKHHKSGIYVDHAGGGGPGGQHCYTTGLLLDYWLTGNESSKLAVLGLAEWITNLYEGKGTLLEYLLGWKNRHRQDLKSFWTGRYPLDRGIGNYINALLDAYYLTSKTSYLACVAKVIRNTAHPRDNLSARDFNNVEETWFYTVFLQALTRFLGVKLERNELDKDFVYARDCLSYYAIWMTQSEYLTLKQPEKLEFPNLTWTAQDLRKVNVLYLASYFDADNSKEFIAKAELLYREICASLLADESRHNTRVMAILMQNQGVREWVKQAQRPELPALGSYSEPSHHAWHNKLKHLSKGLAKALLGMSFHRELNQLRRRFPQLQQYIGTVRESD